MAKAYWQARLAGYSARESVRIAVLVARLSLRDPATDTWGRPVNTFLLPTSGRRSGRSTTSSP
jgi:hypothetical protein